MIMKLCSEQYVLKPYKVYVNDNPELTLIHFKTKSKGGSTLYEIYIGFCPRIDFHNIMHIDCLTYDHSICDIVILLPIYMVKRRDVM